jgi:competence protein ComEC
MITPSFAACLLFGMWFALSRPVPLPWWCSFAIGIMGLVWFRRQGRRRHGLHRAIVAALLGFAWASATALMAMALRLPANMEHREYTLRGTIAELPMHEARRTRFLFTVDDAPDQPVALRGERLRLAWYDDFDAVPVETHAPSNASSNIPRLRLMAGAHWSLTAKLRAPRGLRNPGGVDAERYALIDRIAATGYIRNPQHARQLRAPVGLHAWRERISARIAASVPNDAVPSDAVPNESSSRFVCALALGDTRGLQDEDWSVLRIAGLTHLIAISGFHVGLVAGAFAWLARLLWWCAPMLGRCWPRPQAVAAFALLGALLYTAATGFALPTLRTTAMIAVVAGARMTRRGWRAVDALAVSATGLALLDPLSLLSAGFWLSFAGVAWLLWCMPAPSQRPLRDFLSAQHIATLGLLPLTASMFGQASLIGPLANLFAIPWWSLVVVPLSLSGVLCELLLPGGGTWAWRGAAFAFDPSWALFSRLAAEPAALWWLPEPSWFAMPLAVFAAFWGLMPAGVPGRRLVLLLWLPLLWPDRHLPRSGEVEIVMIDVGQGLSVLVRTAHHTLLYDMGPAIEDGFDAGERAVTPTLHALGVRALDVAVLSHGDNDHAGGFDAVASEFRIAERFAPADSGLQARLASLRDAPLQVCEAGREWHWDGVRFRFLHPPPHFPYLRNESSCVLRIETVHGAALLTGDIGDVIERDLLRREPDAVRADVLTVAHHGSGSSSDPKFVAATGARLALVSAGYGNRFRHPRAEVLTRWQQAGAATPVTANTGALRVRLQAGGPVLVAERERVPRLWDALWHQ